MNAWPKIEFPVNVTVVNNSPDAMAGALSFHGSTIGNASSATWPSANRAIFIPFSLQTPCVVTQLFSFNGSTASGNLDMGIYAADGTRIVSSGSTAQTGNSVLQALNITDTLLGPGLYYLALAMDGTTATIMRIDYVSTKLAVFGMLQQGTAFPLPANATFEALSTTILPFYGLSARSLL